MKKIAMTAATAALLAAIMGPPASAKTLLGEGKCPTGERYAVWHISGSNYGAGTKSFGPSSFGSSAEEAVRKYCRRFS